MAYTTTNAIRTALTTLIKGLSPSGKTFKRDKYRVASPGSDWEERAKSDIDREFTVESIKPSMPLFFGSISEVDYEGSILVIVGHTMSGNKRDGIDRRDTDLHQIKQALEDYDNFPTGVSLIRNNTWMSREIENFWITEIEFSITYALAAP